MPEISPDHKLPDYLTQPVIRTLNSVGVTHDSDVSRLTKPEILSLRGIGPQSIGHLEDEMERAGISYVETEKSNEERT